MVRGYHMDGHNSLWLISLSLLYLYFNVVYMWTLFLLLYTFWKEWWGLVTLCNNYSIISILTCIPSLWLFFNHPITNVTCSHVIYIWTLILVLNTFLHEWSRLVTFWNELLYIISFFLYNASVILFETTDHKRHMFSRCLHLDSIFTSEHVLTRMVTPSNAL
jgi:hypothetical protein